ncbi:hypothetical protein [Trabulsiella odontotermitis]|uniref:hypothetical protein n=1 Tax=Trabulsiella odontotermitis TaxID=379893 RepID=UPI000675E85A|nr:hypothetical protein [Trabulsiella odontotermitis]
MIKVVARSGLKVPMEHNARRYITDKPVVVDECSTYYQRRLRDGDLLPAKDEAEAVVQVQAPLQDAHAHPVATDKKRGHS